MSFVQLLKTFSMTIRGVHSKGVEDLDLTR